MNDFQYGLLWDENSINPRNRLTSKLGIMPMIAVARGSMANLRKESWHSATLTSCLSIIGSTGILASRSTSAYNKRIQINWYSYLSVAQMFQTQYRRRIALTFCSWTTFTYKIQKPQYEKAKTINECANASEMYAPMTCWYITCMNPRSFKEFVFDLNSTDFFRLS